MISVQYQVEAYLVAPGLAEVDVSAYVDEVTITLDVDRVDWKTATVKLDGLPADLRAMADPTTGGVPPAGLNFDVYQVTPGGLSTVYPRPDYTTADPGIENLYTRSYSGSLAAGTLTLQLSSVEALLGDKRRLSGSILDTGATNVKSLVQWISDNSGLTGTIVDRMSAASVAIPAGDRRALNPGETYWSLIEAELNAAGGRFYDDGYSWVLAARTDPPRDTTAGPVTLSTHPDIPGVLVTSGDEEDSRDDDWADAILCRFTYTNSAGNNVTAYQTAGPAVHARAAQYDFARAPTGTNLAAQILTRSINRGRTYTIDAQLDFAVRPGVALTLARPTGTTDLGMCRRVEYRVHEGTMTVTTQVGQPPAETVSTAVETTADLTTTEDREDIA